MDAADAAIIMFDYTSPESYAAIPAWRESIRESHGDIPVVIIGNKAEVRDKRVLPKASDLWGHSALYRPKLALASTRPWHALSGYWVVEMTKLT